LNVELEDHVVSAHLRQARTWSSVTPVVLPGFDDGKQGKALGEYAVKTLKLKRFAVIDDATAYGQGLADEFERAVKASGGAVVKREHTNDKAVDFAPLLTSIKAQKPDAIFFGGYDQQAAPMARQMKTLGMDIKLMGGETMNSAKFIELAGPAAEGHIASTPGAALESRPNGKAFAAKYKARSEQIRRFYRPGLPELLRSPSRDRSVAPILLQRHRQISRSRFRPTMEQRGLIKEH